MTQGKTPRDARGQDRGLGWWVGLCFLLGRKGSGALRSLSHPQAQVESLGRPGRQDLTKKTVFSLQVSINSDASGERKL